MKLLKIALIGTSKDYPNSLVPLIIKNLGYEIQWVDSKKAELIIVGPFGNEKHSSWLPKPIRPLVKELKESFIHVSQGSQNTLKLFQTGESIRPDMTQVNFALSFDINSNPHHLRLPYWMEFIDWSSQGIYGNQNPRFGQLLSMEKLLQPLGNEFLKRPQRAAIISSHLFEPRKTLFDGLSRFVEVEGFGPYFNSKIKNHNQSRFIKKQILQNFAFNLCPENSLYPGYYTEKIPEAFLSGCLPIGYTDENVKIDFNPKAFINLGPMIWNDFIQLAEYFNNKKMLEAFADEPLLLKSPSILILREFISEIILQATT